jgi:iron(III) transport system permease protein
MELASSVSAPRRAFRLNLQRVVCIGTLLLLAIVVLLPIALLVVNTFNTAGPGKDAVYGLKTWREALASPGLWHSLVNTAKVVLTVQGLSLPVAVVVAWLLARTDLPRRRLLEFAYWIPFFLPTLSVTLGWILVLDPQSGLLNLWIRKLSLARESPFNIYSFWGIVFVHLGTFSISMKVMILTPIFRSMDATLEEAARVTGASALYTLRRVVIPLMLPAIVVVFILGTVAGLNAFEIEQLLGLPARFFVFSTQIFGWVKDSPAQFGQATVLGVLVLCLMLPLILGQQWVARKSVVTVSGGMKTQPVPLRRGKWPAIVLVYGLLVFITVIPLIFMLAGSFMSIFGFFDVPDVWTLRHWREVLADPAFGTAFGNTVAVSTGAAAVSVALYSAVAYIIARTHFAGRRAISVLSWMPFAIPGVVLSLGYLWLVFDVPFLTPLYGTVSLLIAVNVLTVMPLGTQILQSTMANLSFELEEAGRISGGSWPYIFRRVIVPLVAPTLVVVAVIAFVSSARQVATVAMLVVGDNHVLSTLQLDYLAGSDFEAASVVGMVIVLLSLAVAISMRLIIRSAVETQLQDRA